MVEGASYQELDGMLNALESMPDVEEYRAEIAERRDVLLDIYGTGTVTPKRTGSVVQWTPEVERGMEIVRRVVVARRPYQEISDALDAVLELPGGDLAVGRVATERVVAVHDQDDAEAERVLSLIAPALATFSAVDRADAVSLVCLDRPALAERYVPAAIADLEDELRQRPDEDCDRMLTVVRSRLERSRGKAS
jgi:hypothetical protein